MWPAVVQLVEAENLTPDKIEKLSTELATKYASWGRYHEGWGRFLNETKTKEFWTELHYEYAPQEQVYVLDKHNVPFVLTRVISARTYTCQIGNEKWIVDRSGHILVSLVRRFSEFQIADVWKRQLGKHVGEPWKTISTCLSYLPKPIVDICVSFLKANVFDLPWFVQ